MLANLTKSFFCVKRSVGICFIVIVNSAVAAELPCLDKSALPTVSGNEVSVSNVAQLNQAMSSLSDNTVIRIQPGTYDLTQTLYIQRDNISIIGDGNNCTDVVLVGNGMDNANTEGVEHGFWTNAASLTVMNLTIRDVYRHGIVFNPGAQSPTINSVSLINTGMQFVKANPTSYGNGVDNGKVENSLLLYETNPPETNHGGGTGYTNGVDVHAGDNWLIKNNVFENFHTLDSADNLWNPAILVWNGATGTVSENNTFIDVDRAIAYGLMQRGEGVDHSGGFIRNNMIYYSNGLFSQNRTFNTDGAIIVWNSPNTAVLHNTILTNGNLNKSIEFRFDTSGGQVVNNLVDATIGTRNNGTYTQQGNVSNAQSGMFVAPQTGNLRLQGTASSVIDQVTRHPDALTDVDDSPRPANNVDVGAHEYLVIAAPNPPTDVTATVLD